MYPEITLRGLSELIPALAQYHNDLPKPVTDGGYYTKTPENRPIICPGPISGYYLIGALSGFGLMASCAAGELIASHLTGDILPGYAESFLLSRYDDEKYLQKFDESKYRGQL